MKLNSVQSEIREILNMTPIEMPTGYNLQHKIINTKYLPKGLQYDHKMSKFFIQQLTNSFYTIYHCRQKVRPQVSNPFNLYEKADFIELLSRANIGHGFLEDGWKIRDIERDGYLAVFKNGLSLWLLQDQFWAGGGKIHIGKKGKILMPKEFRSLLPGFYMANSNEPLNNNSSIVRIYWNIASKGAIPLMKYITSELNGKAIPFHLKIVNNPNNFTRADAGVLYMHKKDLTISVVSLASVYKKVKSFLKGATPLFAKRLVSGISLAEDPHNGESFGQNRSRILAESVYRVLGKNILSDIEKLNEVKRHFRDSKISIDRPYLSFSSRDNYDTILNGAFN